MQAPPPPPPPARIAAVHDYGVQVIEAGGARHTILRSGEDPAWSPDGTRLAVLRWGGLKGSGIVIVDADGSNLQPLRVPPLGGESVASPVWSPDGTRIAYTAESFDGPPSIEIINADGTGRRTVLSVPRGTELWDVSDWTPDDTLLYSRYRPQGYGDLGPSQVRRVNVDGSGDTRVLEEAIHGVLSPDGSQLAFGTYRGIKDRHCGIDSCVPSADLGIANADGTGRRTLLRSDTDEIDPSWSADGEQIAFSSARNSADGYRRDWGDGNELYAIDPEGHCLSWLTNGDRATSSPAWSPDARPGPPTTCGEDIEPHFDIGFGPNREDLLWVGHRLDDTVLGEIEAPPPGEVGGVRVIDLDYSDCAVFDPATCTSFGIRNEEACEPRRYRRARPDEARIVRGMLRLPGAGLVAGRWLVSVSERRLRSRLRTVSGEPVATPVLPRAVRARLRDKIRRATRAC